MSLTDVKRKGYCLQRSASLGAAVTLVSGCGEFTALFECATRCAEVLGDRGLKDLGDGLIEEIPRYRILTEDLHLALSKLSKRFSIALVEYVLQKDGGRFVPLWRINPTTGPAEIEATVTTPTPPISTNPDDY